MMNMEKTQLGIYVVDRSGSRTFVEAKEGASLMELIRENSDDLLALCGGCCSCATCHIYLDDESTGMFPPMSEDEDALLDSAIGRTSGSRLSCQLNFGKSVAGICVTIAPES